MARLLAKTKVTPNQMTRAAFGIALLSLISFILGYNMIAGLLVQLSSIVDGIDGSMHGNPNKVFQVGLQVVDHYTFSMSCML